MFSLHIFGHNDWTPDLKNMFYLEVICNFFIRVNPIFFPLSSIALVLREDSACTEIPSSFWLYNYTDPRFQPSLCIVMINYSSFTSQMNSPWGTSAGAGCWLVCWLNTCRFKGNVDILHCHTLWFFEWTMCKASGFSYICETVMFYCLK